MSAIVNAIDSIISPIADAMGLGKIWDIVVDSANWLVDNIIEPVAEFVFGLLGFEDEDIMSGQAQYTKLIDDKAKSFLKGMLADINDKANDGSCTGIDYGPITSMVSSLEQSSRQFSKPFQMMRNYETVKTPVTTIEKRNLDIPTVEASLIRLTKKLAFVVTAAIKVPSEDLYVRYYLQETYGMLENKFIYDGVEVSYLDTSLDLSSGTYTANCVDDDDNEIEITNIPLHVSKQYFEIQYTINDILYYFVEPVTSWKGGRYFGEAIKTTQAVELMPIIPIRENGVNMNGVKDSTYVDYYKSLTGDNLTDAVALPKADVDNMSPDKKIYYTEHDVTARAMGVTIDSMTASVCSGESLADVDKITDAYVMFAVDIKSESQAVKKVIWHMAKTLAGDLDESASPDGYSGLTAKDEEIIVNTYTGSIRAGTYNTAFTYEPSSRIYYKEAASALHVNKVNITFDGSDLIVSKQIDMYTVEEYTMGKLTGYNMLHRDGYSTLVLANVTDSETRLMIPLIYELIPTLTMEEQVDLYAESLQLVTFASEITHLEWYETPSFLRFIGFIVTVILIIISILTWGATSWITAAWMAFAYGAQYYATQEIRRQERATADLNERLASLLEDLNADIEGLTNESELDIITMLDIVTNTEYTMHLPAETFLYLASGDAVYDNIEHGTNYAAKLCTETKLKY